MAVADNTELMSPDLYSEPWRVTVDWRNQYETADSLKKDLEQYIPLADDLEGTRARFPHSNILLFGPVGTGKSSFLNTVTSTFRGKIFNVARSGCADKSLTTKFARYPIKSASCKRPMNFKLCDSRGLETGCLMTKENMRFLLDGHLVDKFGLEPSNTLNTDSPAYKKNPKLDDKIHCVAIFVDASIVQTIATEIIQNIKDMQTVMNSLDVPQVIILTRVDKICESTRDDVSCVYRSKKVEETVGKVSETFGLPRNNVFPMKNYEKEGCTNSAINILTMYTLKMIMDQADAYLYNQYDDIVQEYKQTGRETKVDE